ncbi:hypothetical protein ACFO1B_54340 [Dactylosporangium siamense]|uniref:Uncharacterized protein n=1 Tax=Dactylosporangium siamense TaxID=685454 RepID=A0A919PW94_9ACTN|nr:hypothetical protein [Dactylosporangium siamense]GIG50837.1 hypothetical protein Dsi01nite_088780 [Dactylosporangium siamense]
MTGRAVRLRSVDTNPIFWPTRLTPARHATPAERFAKCATAVSELYTIHLDAGAPLVAKTSWARFVPVDRPGPARFSGEPATAQLGMGEVHDVPFDPAVLDLPDGARRPAILDWLQEHLLLLAAALGWDTAPLDAAYRACRRDGCRFRQAGPPKRWDGAAATWRPWPDDVTPPGYEWWSGQVERLSRRELPCPPPAIAGHRHERRRT